MQIWTFLGTVNAWSLSNCMRGVYLAPKTKNSLCICNPCNRDVILQQFFCFCFCTTTIQEHGHFNSNNQCGAI